MTNITLHSCLGKEIGENWKLDVSSVSEAIHAIDVLTNGKLYKFFLDSDKKGIKYELLINKKKFKSKKPLNKVTEESLQEVANSELVIKNLKIESIDIVPVIEGAKQIKEILTIIVGLIFVVVGIFTGNPLLIVGGIGLIAAGVINLLSSPPKFEDFTGKIKTSYLFSGPQNTTKEGGPVPVNYGRFIGGSHVISASYEITNIDADPTKGGSSL